MTETFLQKLYFLSLIFFLKSFQISRNYCDPRSRWRWSIFQIVSWTNRRKGLQILCRQHCHMLLAQYLQSFSAICSRNNLENWPSSSGSRVTVVTTNLKELEHIFFSYHDLGIKNVNLILNKEEVHKFWTYWMTRHKYILPNKGLKLTHFAISNYFRPLFVDIFLIEYCFYICNATISQGGFDYFLLLLGKSSIWFTEKHVFKIIIYFLIYWNVPQIFT